MSVLERRPTIEGPAPPPRLSVLAPFGVRDFRLLWFGLLVSNIGTWMQLTTEGFMVVQLAGSARAAALDVGFLGASSAIPVVLLSPLAGFVADNFPRRAVLFLTNSLQILNATTLGVLIVTHHIALWQLFILAGLRSSVQAFDAPARQSWVPLLVPKEIVGNAIGLNSVAFNAPSVLGPPMAGLLIVSVGLAQSYFLNAILTTAVVIALAFMKPAPPSTAKREGVISSIVAGIRFLLTHPVLRSVIIMLVVVCLFVRPYTQLMPAYAAHVVHVDARGLGFLLAASGLGAVAGSVLTAIVGSHRRGLIWFVSAIVMSLGTTTLGLISSFAIALPVLVLTGMAVLSFAGRSNVLLQTLAPADMRGRAISVFSMIILGLVPAGSLTLGSLASVVGLPESIRAGGLVAFVIALIVWWRTPALHNV
jgi:MFS family permease